MKEVGTLVPGSEEFKEAYPKSKRVNVLLLGVNEGMTDTIMLASFDTEQKRVDVISIPRDSYYERPDYPGPAHQKINSIYKDEGPEGTARAVSKILFGMPIHYYAVITDDGVAHVVDAMGGIEMDVPMDMKYDDPTQNLHIDLKAGPQVLNGGQAVQYLRFRKGYPTGDLGRVDAQQSFLKQAFDKTISLSFPKVAVAFIQEVNTDIDLKMMIRLGKKAIGMGMEDFCAYTVSGVPQTINGTSYYLVDEIGVKELVENIYNSENISE